MIGHREMILHCLILKKTEWATYRQTLRDLPASKDAATRKAMSKDENHSDWPTEPS